MTDVSLGIAGVSFPTYRPSPNSTGMGLLDAEGEYAGWVFSVPKSGTLTSISFPTGAISTGGNLSARIETVNDTTGAPSGTLYHANGTGTITVNASDDNTVLHVSINGGAGCPVTKGDIVAVKLTADAVFYGNILLTTTVPALTFGYSFSYVGGVFSTSLVQTLLSLVIDGAYYSPLGFYAAQYINTTAWGSDHNPDRVGAAFSCPIDMRAIGLGFFIDIDTDMTVYLFDTDGATVLESRSYDTNIRGGTGGGFCGFLFGTARTFLKGQTYRFAVLPSDATHLTIFHGMTVLNGALNPFSGDSGGVNFYKTTCNGAPTGLGSWTDTPTVRLQAFIIIDQISYSGSGGGSGLILL